MSRCFPFPPPGYSAKISINETLIESIKLQRETDKAKAERKKERRRKEKKDKRREKKENDKSLNAVVDEKGRDDKCETKKRKRNDEKVRKSGDKKRCREDKSPKQQSEKKFHAEEKPKLDEEKGRVNTNELLEKSDLSQEHEQPFYSQNTYCLSDSSENSNQRRLQQATTLHENVVNAQGKQLIRIRLPSLKNQPVAAASLSTNQDEQPCSTSGRADSETGDGYKLLPKNVETISSDPPLGIKGIISNLNLKQTAHVVPSSSSSSFEKKMKKVELVYKALVENLGPSLNEEMPDTNDDFDWLFKRSEKCCKPVAAAAAANNNGGGDERSSSTMWPRAHYLAEADVYLMPFTIPF